MSGYTKENQPSQSTDANEKQDTAYNPLASVITPVRDSIKYLEICIQSVLNQSYPHIEHIFIDGGSTDGSLDLLAKYNAKYPDRIRFISEPDKGLGEAVNKGFSMARGQIFSWIDSDDIYEPDAIMTVVEFFQANPDAYFVFGGCNMINEKGEVIARFILKDFNLRDALHNRHHIYLSSVFYKREVVERVGMLNTIANDLDFYIRVHKVFQMHRLDKVLSSWRLHEDSISLGKETIRINIRKEKLRQDCILCIRNGGSILSPRCLRYYVAVLSPIVEALRPIIGRFYPSINKRLGLDYYPFVET